MNLKILFTTAFILAAACAVATQTRKPSTAIRPFLVKTKQDLSGLEKKLSTDNKVEDLIGGPGMETRVAIQHDKERAAGDAELHDASDDVYYVLKGTATLELGGTLVDPREISPGEWRSKTVNGAQTVVIKEGDLVTVPRGTPHRRTVSKKGFSMILIKVFEDPLPPAK